MRRSPGTISLNCIDKAILAFDCANEPFIIHAIIDAEGGEIDPRRLGQSIAAAQKAFPIMRSILRWKYFWPYREAKSDLGDSVLTYTDMTRAGGRDYESVLFEWMNRRFDLAKEFPVRALLAKKNDRESTVVFTFHHSSTDALRACVFMRRVIETYNNDTLDDPPEGEDIRMGRRKDELFEFAQSQRHRVKRFYLKMVKAIGYRLFVAAIPSPSRIRQNRSGRSRVTHICNQTISVEQLRELEAKATAAGVELNDIFLAAAYRMLDKWNRLHGKAAGKVRVMAPVNLSPKGFRGVLCNQVSWFSIPTRPEDRADPAKLLKKLRSAVIYESVHRIAFSLVYFFYFASRPPLFVTVAICRLFLFLRTYVDSVLFTNIGVVWPKVGTEESVVSRIGDAKIINFTGSAPVLTHWKLSFGASIYEKTLNVSLTYRPAMFSREEARQFLNMFMGEVTDYQTGSK